MKICSHCKQEKDVSNFRVYKNRGYRLIKTYCRDCEKTYRHNEDNRIRFGNKRDIVLARDNYKCVKCGMTRAQHKLKYRCDLTVDHIDGNGSLKPRDMRNNQLSNLQTLCLSCHARK